MKTLILAAALTLVSAQAVAETEQELIMSLCVLEEGTARLIMQARQVGRPMRTLLEAIEDPSAQQVIRDAYDQPRWPTVEYQELAVNDFADSSMLACLDRY